MTSHRAEMRTNLPLKDPDAIVDESGSCQISKAEAAARAKAAFEEVFTNGPKIELEHHLVYHARKFTSGLLLNVHKLISSDYELGRLLSREGDEEAAKTQFDLVLSGKPLEATSHGRKGKYSMEVSMALCRLKVSKASL
jgi:hypothetical protein